MKALLFSNSLNIGVCGSPRSIISKARSLIGLIRRWRINKPIWKADARQGIRSFAAVACLLLASQVSVAEAFRMSKIDPTEGKFTDRMVLKAKGGNQLYFVQKEPILTADDVEHALADFSHVGSIDVSLKASGKKKLREFTQSAIHGQDRLAVVVDGKLVAVWTITGTLTGDFVLGPFYDLSEFDRDRMARSISRKSTQNEGKGDKSSHTSNPQPGNDKPAGKGKSSRPSDSVPRQPPEGQPPAKRGSAPE